MRFWTMFLIGMSLHAADLIQVSNNASTSHLITLSQKYHQPLLIEGDKVYLVPSSCRLDRYFGGTSQGELRLIKVPDHAESIPMTQEVFEAKESTQIIKKIEQEKIIAIAEAKTSRAFLEDKEGRGFGGASQVPLDFSWEKVQVLQEVVPTATPSPVPVQAVASSVLPKCEILNDGSGYRIESSSALYLYENSVLKPLMNNMVRFE